MGFSGQIRLLIWDVWFNDIQLDIQCVHLITVIDLEVAQDISVGIYKKNGWTMLKFASIFVPYLCFQCSLLPILHHKPLILLLSLAGFSAILFWGRFCIVVLWMTVLILHTINLCVLRGEVGEISFIKCKCFLGMKALQESPS